MRTTSGAPPLGPLLSATGAARVLVARELRFLLARQQRERGEVGVPVDGTSSVVHVVESLGVPRTEIGLMLEHGTPVSPTYRLHDGDEVLVQPVLRPQRLATPRFLLDVHLGALARRMRLVGLDAAYRNHADDDELVFEAANDRRVLLTRDRGLLRRRALRAGAYVRGDHPDDQLADVLDRFRVNLMPWTRCLACNGLLHPVTVDAVAHLLKPGTIRSFTAFSCCGDCARPYWRGAHSTRLDAIVGTAEQAQS